MDRTVIWVDTGWNDLEAVADHIAKDSLTYAGTFVREVQDAARSLRRFAERGRVVPEFRNSGLHELFIRRYRLIYRLDDSTVSIIAFIHGARDLSALFKREGRLPPADQ